MAATPGAGGNSDPEDASAFLTRTNFKSIVEWLTAEAILNRPEDPMTYVRDLCDMKLCERGAEAYAADHATKYVQSCYSEAASLADEDGRIYGKVVRAPKGVGGAKAEKMRLKAERLERLLKAAGDIQRSITPREACAKVVQVACDLLNADRASIFTAQDPEFKGGPRVLMLRVADDSNLPTIRVPFGVGIAGTVADTGDVCNIHDAYTDPRFDPRADKESGYKTQNILCAPIRDHTNKIVGVIQVINKNTGPFTDDDEDVLGVLSTLAAASLRNADLYDAAVSARTRADATMDLVKTLYDNLGVNSVVHTLTNRLPDVIDCDRCTVFVIDSSSDEMWALQGDVNVKFPLDAPGLAPTCGREVEVINIPDAYKDHRFNQNIDKQTNYTTKSILCHPVCADNGETCVGVVQLINKNDGAPFTAEDEKLLAAFLSIVGEILKRLTMSKSPKKKKHAMDDDDMDADLVSRPSEGAEKLDAFDEDEEGSDEGDGED